MTNSDRIEEVERYVGEVVDAHLKLEEAQDLALHELADLSDIEGCQSVIDSFGGLDCFNNAERCKEQLKSIREKLQHDKWMSND